MDLIESRSKPIDQTKTGSTAPFTALFGGSIRGEETLTELPQQFLLKLQGLEKTYRMRVPRKCKRLLLRNKEI
jgi:hypothetical protein